MKSQRYSTNIDGTFSTTKDSSAMDVVFGMTSTILLHGIVSERTLMILANYDGGLKKEAER